MRSIFCLAAFALLATPTISLAAPSFSTTPQTPSSLVPVEGRKGTRNYVPDEASDVTGETAVQKPPMHEDRIEQCMESWDSRTHITKAHWKAICERQLSEEPTP